MQLHVHVPESLILVRRGLTARMLEDQLQKLMYSKLLSIRMGERCITSFFHDSGLCWTSPQVSLSAQWAPYNVCPFLLINSALYVCVFRPNTRGKTPVAIWSYTILRKLYWIRTTEVCSVSSVLISDRQSNLNHWQAFISKQQAASH